MDPLDFDEMEAVSLGDIVGGIRAGAGDVRASVDMLSTRQLSDVTRGIRFPCISVLGLSTRQ